MGVGISIFLLAAGAVLMFAVPGTHSGFNFDAIGVVLLVVGAIGLVVASMIAASSRREDVTVVERGHDHR